MRLILACLIVLLPSLVQAQQFPCGWAEDLERKLRDMHHETPVSSGVMDEQSSFRIYASPDGKTWTAMILTADGLACLVNTGEWWKQGPMPKPGRPI